MAKAPRHAPKRAKTAAKPLEAAPEPMADTAPKAPARSRKAAAPRKAILPPEAIPEPSEIAAEPPKKARPLTPRMTADEKSLLVDTLRGVESYVEFGAGGSTALAVQLGIASIWSVESDPAWIARLAADAEIAPAVAAGRVHLLHGDIGPVEAWGYPAGHSDRTLEHIPPVSAYHAGIWSRLDPKSIDAVFVDGRYRVASALEAVARCRPDLRLIMHDFWKRRRYSAVFEFAAPIVAAGTLVVFEPRPGLDHAALARAIEAHSRRAE